MKGTLEGDIRRAQIVSKGQIVLLQDKICVANFLNWTQGKTKVLGLFPKNLVSSDCQLFDPFDRKSL